MFEARGCTSGRFHQTPFPIREIKPDPGRKSNTPAIPIQGPEKRSERLGDLSGENLRNSRRVVSRATARERCRRRPMPDRQRPIRPAPLHAPERRLRHRPVDHGGLLWCRERGRNPGFESGHLRRRVAKIANGPAPHTTSVRKAMSPAKTHAAGKAVRRSDHTGQRQYSCKNRFHDRVPHCSSAHGPRSNHPPTGCLVGLASIGAVLWSSGRLMP